MGYSYDFFVARLRCPRCGHVSAPDDSTNMQTSIQADPQLAFIGAGDPIDPDIDDQLEDRQYLMIRRPADGEPLVILETWDCPACDKPLNWARITVGDRVVESIDAVELTSAELDRANLISRACIDEARELTDLPYDTLVDADLVPLLRDALRAAGR